MRFLQQHAEVIVVACVAASLALCGALYWIFNHAYPHSVVTTEPISYAAPAVVETPAPVQAPDTGGTAAP